MDNYIVSVSLPAAPVMTPQGPILPTDDLVTFFCSCGGRIDFNNTNIASEAINEDKVICPQCLQRHKRKDYMWLFGGKGQTITLPQSMYKEVENENEEG
mgnify:FL=1|jgi:hypothetical protein